MRVRNRTWWALAVVGTLTSASAAVASADSAPTFAGQPFFERHHGSSVSGQVCGLDVDLDVRATGGGADLTGFLDGDRPARVSVRDEAGGRRLFAGALGTQAGGSVVDLALTADRLVGRVGFRRFDLTRRGDDYVGKLRIAGVLEDTDAVVHGRAALLAMPAADAGAVLPALLTCYVAPLGRHGGVTPFAVGVGGKPGALPRGSSSVYTGK